MSPIEFKKSLQLILDTLRIQYNQKVFNITDGNEAEYKISSQKVKELIIQYPEWSNKVDSFALIKAESNDKEIRIILKGLLDHIAIVMTRPEVIQNMNLYFGAAMDVHMNFYDELHRRIYGTYL